MCVSCLLCFSCDFIIKRGCFVRRKAVKAQDHGEIVTEYLTSYISSTSTSASVYAFLM